jgi:hypothetical protein
MAVVSRKDFIRQFVEYIKPLVDKSTKEVAVEEEAVTETPEKAPKNADGLNGIKDVRNSQDKAEVIESALENLLLIKGIIDKKEFTDIVHDNLDASKLTLTEQEVEQIAEYLVNIYKALQSPPLETNLTDLSFYDTLNKLLLESAGTVKLLADTVARLWSPFESEVMEDQTLRADAQFIQTNLKKLQTVSTLHGGLDLYAIVTARLTTELQAAKQAEKKARPLFFFTSEAHKATKREVERVEGLLQSHIERQILGPWKSTLIQLRSDLAAAEAAPANKKPWFSVFRTKAKQAYDTYQRETIAPLKLKIKNIEQETQKDKSNGILALCRYLPATVLEAVNKKLKLVPAKVEGASSSADDAARSEHDVVASASSHEAVVSTANGAPSGHDIVASATHDGSTVVSAAPLPLPTAAQTKSWLEDATEEEKALAIGYARDLTGTYRFNLIKPDVAINDQPVLSFIEKFALILKYSNDTSQYLNQWLNCVANDLMFVYDNRALSHNGHLGDSPTKKAPKVGFTWLRSLKAKLTATAIKEAANNLHEEKPSKLLADLFAENLFPVDESLDNLATPGDFITLDNATTDDNRNQAGNFFLNILNVLLHGTDEQRSQMTAAVNKLIEGFTESPALYSPDLGKILNGLKGEPVELSPTFKSPRGAATPQLTIEPANALVLNGRQSQLTIGAPRSDSPTPPSTPTSPVFD